MSGMGTLALGALPVLGGSLLALLGGEAMGGLGFRSGIREDFELLELLPDEEEARKAALRQSIMDRIDDLIEASAKRRQLRAAVYTHATGWRDIVMFLNTVLFTIVCWNVDHARNVWLPLFVVLVLAMVVAAMFAFRSVMSPLRRARARVGKR